jgi:hypothetical protein
MSGFAPGDVVVCVAPEHSTCRHHRTAPNNMLLSSGVLAVGRSYTVANIIRGKFGPCGTFGIDLAEVKSPVSPCFCPGCFRKIDPASDEFTEQMRAIKPVREQVPA